MKCISCGVDNNLKDRTSNSGRCKNCGHPFAFDPQGMTKVKFTDIFFCKAIETTSAGSSLFFTPKQLHYLLDKQLKSKIAGKSSQWLLPYFFLNLIGFSFVSGLLFDGIPYPGMIFFFVVNFFYLLFFFSSTTRQQDNIKLRRKNARNLQILGGFILAFGITLSLFLFNSFLIFTVSVILGMVAIYLGVVQRIKQSKMAEEFLISASDFLNWIDRWMHINGTIEKMLSAPSQELTTGRINPDLTNYSFDRVVVCDRAEIAQMLIANNFHFENNCAILSVDGYPHGIFDTIMGMLQRNPNLKVYAFHDASPGGVLLTYSLQTSPDWFLNQSIEIYDIGLLPRQVLNSRNMFICASSQSAQEARRLPPEVRQELSPDELAWLELGNYVELESFSPQKLLRILLQGIGRSQVNLPEGIAGDSFDSDGYGYGAVAFMGDDFG